MDDVPVVLDSYVIYGNLESLVCYSLFSCNPFHFAVIVGEK